jgi:hypothetical protein
MIKLRRMRCAGHVARMGAMNTKFYLENLKGRDHFEDLDVDGILRWVLKKQEALQSHSSVKTNRWH